MDSIPVSNASAIWVNWQKRIPSAGSQTQDFSNGTYAGETSSFECGCPVEGCKIGLVTVTYTPITNIIINLQENDGQGNWTATDPPYFGSIQPNCVPCGGDYGSCICKDAEVSAMQATFTLPRTHDWAVQAGDYQPVFRLKIQLTGPCTSYESPFEIPNFIILGNAGWLETATQNPIERLVEGSNEWWAIPIYYSALEFICRAGDNYDSWPPFYGETTTCPDSSTHLNEGGFKPPTEKPDACSGPSCQFDHEPSSSECNRTQNVAISHLGERGLSHIPCTCWSCDDKCLAYSWDPPTGWSKGLIVCAYPGALEFEQYAPNGPGDFICTISRCNPCYETYGPQAWPIKHTEPCVAGLYLGTSNGEACWTVDCPCAETYAGGLGIDSDFDFWCERSTTGYRERFDGGAWVETTFPCSC